MIPFLLSPVCKSSVWGGQNLKTLFGKTQDGPNISECWELSVHPAGVSHAANGPFSGSPLSDLVKDPALLGKNCDRFADFPLMIKWIDSEKPLSIQVHPDDAYAKQHENDFGKTEMWYILDSQPQSYLYYGFRRQISKQELIKRIENNTILEVLNKTPVQKGDVFFIPAGTVHAIGPGILLAEVQQSSNVTYRLYDYNRPDENGQLRELHIQKAAEVLHLHPPEKYIPVPVPKTHPEDMLLVSDKSFAVTLCQISKTRAFAGAFDSFHAFICTNGNGQLAARHHSFSLQAGDTVFVPANSEPFSLDGTLEFLDVFVPPSGLFQ